MSPAEGTRLYPLLYPKWGRTVTHAAQAHRGIAIRLIMVEGGLDAFLDRWLTACGTRVSLAVRSVLTLG
jgi:hypothetical protein